MGASSMIACGAMLTCARLIRDCSCIIFELTTQPECSRSAASSSRRISAVELGKSAVATQTARINSWRCTFLSQRSTQATGYFAILGADRLSWSRVALDLTKLWRMSSIRFRFCSSFLKIVWASSLALSAR